VCKVAGSRFGSTWLPASRPCCGVLGYGGRPGAAAGAAHELAQLHSGQASGFDALVVLALKQIATAREALELRLRWQPQATWLGEHRQGTLQNTERDHKRSLGAVPHLALAA
jgi:hypothetical protein